MIKRFAIIILLALIPLAAMAEDAPASMLGPSTSSSLGGGNLSADAAQLQPAGTSDLQPDGSQSSGLTAPNSSAALQNPASTEEVLKVLNDEADGEHAELEKPTHYGVWFGSSLIIGLIIFIGYGLIAKRRRAIKHNHVENSSE